MARAFALSSGSDGKRGAPGKTCDTVIYRNPSSAHLIDVLDNGERLAQRNAVVHKDGNAAAGVEREELVDVL